MRPWRLAAGVLCACALLAHAAPQQDSNNVFEFPVELVGFPIIVMAVRIANFVRKLGYTLSPRTYADRGKRSALSWTGDLEPGMDASEVEKALVAEMGQKVSVYERICVQFAEQALGGGSAGNHLADWNTLLRASELSSAQEAENYLLSVFLGDILHSPALCRQLAKRGRACK